jgi:carbamoyltransferase
MTAILGISAFYHDSAAALVVDGRIVAAAQEERFSRRKHDPELPTHAIDYCLAAGGLTPEQLDFVGFYDKPLLKFDRLLETYLAFAPVGFRSFLRAAPLWLHQKLHLPRELRGALGGRYRKRFVFTEHHESHAASAFFPSPFERAAILTLDGVGEWATASFGTGQGNRIALSHEMHFPHSLGLLYSAFTYFCGFRVNSGEYKLMGLAPYGEPTYTDTILRELVDLKEDGSLRLNLRYFNYCQGLTMTSPRFDRLFGGPPRRPEQPLTQREMDLAASVQKVTEEAMLRAARHVHRQTGLTDLCLAGGVALNCVANGRLLAEGPFQRLWIQPAAGDAGAALGTGLFIWHQLLDNPRTPQGGDAQQGSLLGPAFDEQQTRQLLDARGAKYRVLAGDEELCGHVAELIAGGKVVGWVQGRMEFGPRALGSRSILGDARDAAMQSRMNRKIKFRESFRPFAPVVLAERATEFFDMPRGQESPYMLLVAPVARGKRTVGPGTGDRGTGGPETGKGVSQSSFSGRRNGGQVPAPAGTPEAPPTRGLDMLHVARSVIPAVTHVDGSARVQTADPARHPLLHRLLRAFEARTGCPVLINTSFNVRGEPIVCTPEHALRCFLATNMDVLVLGHCVLLKADQPDAKEHPIDEYLAQFQPD